MAAHSSKSESKKNKNSTTGTNTDTANGAKKNDTVEVLYQRLGDRWYAFSLIDDEVFVGSIDPSEIENNRGNANNGPKVSS